MEKKLSLKKNHNMMLTDVETCNKAKICMEISYHILNNIQGKIKTRCFIIKEVWENDFFRNGEFAKGKIEHWEQMISSGVAKVLSIYHIKNIINKDIKEYDIKLFTAYNAGFDWLAIQKTYDKFKIPYNENKIHDLELFDLWEYAKAIYCSKQFKNWVIKHNGFTDKGNPKSNAETVYQFIVENGLFVETHFGIEDLDIEYVILMVAIQQNTLNRNNQLMLNKKGNWRTIKTYFEKGIIQ